MTYNFKCSFCKNTYYYLELTHEDGELIGCRACKTLEWVPNNKKVEHLLREARRAEQCIKNLEEKLALYEQPDTLVN
jgi:hypothetical protein